MFQIRFSANIETEICQTVETIQMLSCKTFKTSNKFHKICLK